MNIDELLKKIHALKDLRHAIGVVKSADLEKANPPAGAPQSAAPNQALPKLKAEGQKAMAAVPQAQRGNWKHGGIDTQKLKGAGIVSHIIKVPGVNTPYHYMIDVDMNKLDGKNTPYSVHQVDSKSGQAIESHGKPHRDIASAVRAMMTHASGGNWE